MPFRPEESGERPTLGGYVIDWAFENLIIPDGPSAGDPLEFTLEQQLFILKLYELDPHMAASAIQSGALKNGRLIRRAVLSRMKGWGKSPIVAALCIIEALADVVPDGWDADGRPVGRPWASLGFKPKTQVVAVSEDQTVNTWDPLLEMCRSGPVAKNYQIEPLETFVNVPRGRIEFTTSEARSREGFRPVFAALDQTESWIPSIGGPRLAATIRRNLTKTSGLSVETPNAFVPGEDSVAEKSWEAWKLQQAGKLKTTGILFDHREMPADTDVTDHDSLYAGIEYARGDSVWLDIERVIRDWWDPDTDPQDARRYYGNQVTHAIDAWITQPEWAARVDVNRIVADRERITLGFDGSRHRARGIADATALIGCTLDGHLFEIGIWQQPEGPAGKNWWAPVVEIEAAVKTTFERYNVVGFFADPAADWAAIVATWEARYNSRLLVKSNQSHPIGWHFSQTTKVVNALAQFHAAVVNEELTHDGSYMLTSHVLNARRRPSRSGLQIGKEHPESARKIDGAIAGMLAWQARLEAVAREPQLETFVPRRIR